VFLKQLAKLVRVLDWRITTLYEGFGIYYIEWMAAGTVPITFSNIGTRSLICDSKAGVLAENISELRDAALCILKDSSIRDTYSRNSVATANFSVGTI